MTHAPPPESPLLEARGLCKLYRMGGQDLQVLRGVDLEVHAGRWVAVLGVSGSGKSTLLHLLGGLDRPDQGQVVFEGRQLFRFRGRKLDRYRNRRVGFVFQFYHLLPELSALENVMIASMIGTSSLGWRRSRVATRRRAELLLDQLGLSHRLKHRPAKLSGGERQRIAIARALINEPALLLADEPTGNLDAETGGQILEVLREFHNAGQTIVMVTHDPVVASAADEQLTLERGQIMGEIRDGGPPEVRESAG